MKHCKRLHLSRRLGILIVTTVLCARAQESEPLTNQHIAQLLHAGVSANELVRLISTAPEVAFDLSPSGTDALLKAGVSEAVIRAMAARETGAVSPPKASAAASSSGTSASHAENVKNKSKDRSPVQKTFDAPPERVYAAMVQAAGAEITAAVKEGCLVNLQTWVSTNFTQGEYRMAVRCVDIGDGKTVVTLEAQTLGTVQNGASLFRGAGRDKFVRVYWQRLDNALGQQPNAAADPPEKIRRELLTRTQKMFDRDQEYHGVRVSLSGEVFTFTGAQFQDPLKRSEFASRLVSTIAPLRNDLCGVGIRTFRLEGGDQVQTVSPECATGK